MKLQKHMIILLALSVIGNILGKSYILNGEQKSNIHYRLVQQVKPSSKNVKEISLNYIQPQNFSSPTYKQIIKKCNFEFSLLPSKSDTIIDAHKNKMLRYTWVKPNETFTIKMNVIANNSVTLNEISPKALFPLKNIPENVKKYLTSTEMVPVNNREIQALSKKLVKTSKTEIDAIQKILTWIVDHMKYIQKPQQYDALYSLKTGKGNCQNYSHLTAALLRSVGIPVRISNGITMKKPYDVIVKNSVLTLDMAQGRHSWIEVYFPDLGWIPFDPQQSELFVSNRFIRVEVGIDNIEANKDGLVRWTRKRGSNAKIVFNEVIEANFLVDKVSIFGDMQNYGPKNIILQPHIKGLFAPIVSKKVPKLVEINFEKLLKLNLNTPYTIGNIDFPEGVNLAFVRESKKTVNSEIEELTNNFLVETAEYVTGSKDFSQAFILRNPLHLKKISLALHKFGGNGKLWIELRDDNNNSPGQIGAKSLPISLNQLSSDPGYFWVDFSFSSNKILLSPDKYWITLGYSGSPIINWFYSYGKSVGPVDGTRSKKKEEKEWKRRLSYEFIYKINGLTTKKMHR